jgi:hypothetical protein
VKRGELRAYWAGRLLRIRRDELDAYLARPLDEREAIDVDKKIVQLHSSLRRR